MRPRPALLRACPPGGNYSTSGSLDSALLSIAAAEYQHVLQVSLLICVVGVLIGKHCQ